MKLRPLALCIGIALLVPQWAYALLIRLDEQPKVNATAKDPAAARYVEGVMAMEKKDVANAERLFREAIAIDAKAHAPLIGMADLALRRNQPKEAWQWLQKAVAVAPGQMAVHQSIGRYHYALGEYTQAEKPLREAIALAPNSVLAYLDLGDLYLNALNRPEDAEHAYRKAVSLGPKHAGARNGLGVALVAQGKYAEAQKEVERAIELAPNNVLPRLSLARTHQSQGAWDKAIAAYDDALEMAPKLLPALLGKADALVALGKGSAALPIYIEATQSARESDIAQLKLGMAYQGMGRMDAASKAYKEAIRINPELALAYNNLAWMAAERQQDLDQAQTWVDKAITLSPQEPLFLDTLAWIQRARKEFSQAETTLKKAAAMPGAGAEIWYHLGVIYEDQHKSAEAAQAYGQAVTLDKSFAAARKALEALKK